MSNYRHNLGNPPWSTPKSTHLYTVISFRPSPHNDIFIYHRVGVGVCLYSQGEADHIKPCTSPGNEKREGTSPFSFLMLASLSILGNCSRRLTAPSGDWLSALAMPQQVLGGRERRPSVPSVPWQAASPSQTRRHSPPGGSQPFSWHSHSSESSGSACAHMNAVA